MTLIQLNDQEIEIYKRVIEIYDEGNDSLEHIELQSIFKSYQEIHRQYAELSENNIEALKRGLFLQWISFAELPDLTGVSELDESYERKIIINLQKLIESHKVDKELRWMLNYFLSWDWIFERYADIAIFEKTDDPNEISKPKGIDKSEMNNRGQMGIYWNMINL